MAERNGVVGQLFNSVLVPLDHQSDFANPANRIRLMRRRHTGLHVSTPSSISNHIFDAVLSVKFGSKMGKIRFCIFRVINCSE